jgi:phosphatidylinositol alpha-1,6-mannosyltransferase
MKKRILIISRNFPPLVGGMERLIFNVYRQLNQEYLCDVVGPCGCRAVTSTESTVRECPSGSIYAFLVMSGIQGFLQSVFHRPDLIIAGSGVTAPVVCFLGKLLKVPTLTFIHGLDIIADNYVYQKIFVPAIACTGMIIANSYNTKKLAVLAGINDQKIEIIFPGVDVTTKEETTFNLREEYNIGERKILLSVGRLIHRKGIVEFLEHSFPTIVKEVPDTLYIIIGSPPKDAIKKDVNIISRIKELVENLDLHDNILLLGEVSENVLIAAYKESDVFVFPLLDTSNDVEGFGMVAVEAAAHGLPTIAFNVGGVADAVVHGQSGVVVAPGEYRRLSAEILRFIKNKHTEITPETCRLHAENFSWTSFGNQLRKHCSQLFTGNIS